MAGNYDIAASIKLGGESEFRQAVNRASTELRSMDSALRHTTEQFALNDPSRMVYCSTMNLVLYRLQCEKGEKKSTLADANAISPIAGRYWITSYRSNLMFSHFL